MKFLISNFLPKVCWTLTEVFMIIIKMVRSGYWISLASLKSMVGGCLVSKLRRFLRGVLYRLLDFFGVTYYEVIILSSIAIVVISITLCYCID